MSSPHSDTTTCGIRVHAAAQYVPQATGMIEISVTDHEAIESSDSLPREKRQDREAGRVAPGPVSRPGIEQQGVRMAAHDHGQALPYIQYRVIEATRWRWRRPAAQNRQTGEQDDPATGPTAG